MPTLNIQGRRVQVDDSFLALSPEQQDATVDEIAASFGSAPSPAPASPGPQVAPAPASPGPQAAPAPPQYFGTEPQAVNAPPPASPLRTVQVGAQGVGRGLLNALMTAPELATAGANLALGTADKGLAAADWVSQKAGAGPISARVGYRFPSPSETASDLISRVAPTIDPAAMTPAERTAYEINKFGGETAAGVGVLSRLARTAPTIPQRIAGTPTPPTQPVPTGLAAIRDVLSRPYEGGGSARTLAGDAGAAAGAGYATSQVEQSDYLKDSALAKFVAALGGGAIGSNIPSVIRSPVSSLQRLREYMPDPATGTSGRVADLTADFIRSKAVDPEAAAARFSQRAAEARAVGAPTPTFGLGSDDLGLIAMEKGMRAGEGKMTPPVPFSRRDQEIGNFVQGEVTGLRDPQADQGYLTRWATERPNALREVRDDTSLPLLRRAEQNPAQVDVRPVVRAIETMRREAKRPAVLHALDDARAALNVANDPQSLDTTVRGLYESRKAINDLIEGRTETPTGRFAQAELIEVRNELDAAINRVAPEFGQYLQRYRVGSEVIDPLAENNTFTKLQEKDPRTVAAGALRSPDYGAEREFNFITQEVTGGGRLPRPDNPEQARRFFQTFRNDPEALRRWREAFNGDPEARRAWRAAVAEVLTDEVTGTNTALTGGAREGPVRFAALSRVLKDNEKALSNLFGPEDMNKLRRAQKFLEPFGNLQRRALTGSQTEENKQLRQMVENAVLAYTGNAVTAGMIMHRLKRAAELVPGVKNLSVDHKITSLVERMALDPDLFEHIISRPVRRDPPAWNKRLSRLLAYREGAEELNDEAKK